MKKDIIFVAMAALLLLSSCEKQIDIDLTQQERIVVMHSLATNDKPISVDVTLSRPVFGWHSSDEAYGNSPFPGVSNATATLSVKGGGTYSASHDSNHYSFAYTPQYGDEMELHIEVPGKETLTSSTTMPFPPSLGTIEMFIETNQYSEDEFHFRIPISDPAGKENYYSVAVQEYFYFDVEFDSDSNILSYSWVDSNYNYLNCSDPLIVDHNISDAFMDPTAMPEFWGSTLYFDDSRINGTTHTVEIKTGRRVSGSDLCIVKLHISALSREEYFFHTSTQALNDVEDILSFFSEPSAAYSNVEGGAGVFGAHVTTVREIVVRN